MRNGDLQFPPAASVCLHGSRRSSPSAAGCLRTAITRSTSSTRVKARPSSSCTATPPGPSCGAKSSGSWRGKRSRVIAPDLVGLGLSSKPRDPRIHTLDFHANRISTLVEALDLHDITIAGQDWGGPIIAVMAARNRAADPWSRLLQHRHPRAEPAAPENGVPSLFPPACRERPFLPRLQLPDSNPSPGAGGSQQHRTPANAEPTVGRCAGSETGPHPWLWRDWCLRALTVRPFRT